MSNYSSVAFSVDPNNTWNKVFNYIRPGTKILDVGCSSGNIGEIFIKEKKCIVDGIELDLEDSKRASKKLRKVYQLNVEESDLDVLVDKYDYVYFGDVIEHLVDPISTLKKIKGVLKPNGEVVFSIPNMAHLAVRLMLLSGKFDYAETGLLDKTHLHFYTFDEIQRVFNEAGLTISYLDPVFKDYKKDIAKEKLANIGLKTTEKFFKYAKTAEAVTFQYVGAAKRTSSKVKPAKLPQVSPSGEEFEQGKIENLEQKIEQITRENHQKIDSLKDEVASLNAQLELIKNSKAYKAANKLAKLAKR